ncbi:uncharacterized protein LOC129582408 [Paramacrobiotus metropolitanus]|uniref:uncharacterized protein LOC129582408 n=1 Tax=Paramacrobiotus metropolitanus TaxID=2943436 RepID=UPI002446019A|nr:uncharacterized protein LOC129582408 [Paramacrobiotus metropolitanus]
MMVAAQITYTCNFMVDAGPSYPQIPAGQWTVTLTIDEGTTAYEPEISVIADVRPKEKLTSPTAVSVHCKVGTRKSAYDHLIRIGPAGATKTPKRSSPENLTDLVEGFMLSHSDGARYQHELKSDRTVHIHLGFFIPSNATTTRADMQRLRDPPSLCDGVLECGGQEFPIHRALLANHSPVLATRFQNALDVGLFSAIKVDDVSAETLAAMIQFVYTREEVTADVSGGLWELYSAAGRYGIAELRRECLRVMKESGTGFPVFCFSGVPTAAEKQRVIAAVTSLGGRYIDSVKYETGCTHLLIKVLTRNEKFLAYTAAGKWILDMQYIHDSLTAGHFLPEEMYEWGNVEKACINTAAQEDDLAMAAYRWRRRVQRTRQGAFADWKVVLVADANRVKGYARVLQAGGATVLTDRPPYSPFVNTATHLLRESKGPTMNAAEYASYQAAGVSCHAMDYLAHYLCLSHAGAAKAAKSRPAPQEEEEAPNAKQMRR